MALDLRAIGPADLDRYADRVASVGVVRTGFDLHRAFDSDAVDNATTLAERGRLKMPVPAVSPIARLLPPLDEETLREVAEDVTVVPIPRCGY